MRSTVSRRAVLASLVATLALPGLARADAEDDALALAAGRPLAVLVMKRPDCPVCVDALVEAAQRHAELDPHGVVIALTVAEPEVARALAARTGTRVLADPGGEVAARWGLFAGGRVMPGVVWFDPCGRLAGILRGRSAGDGQLDVVRAGLAELKGVRCEPTRAS